MLYQCNVIISLTFKNNTIKTKAIQDNEKCKISFLKHRSRNRISKDVEELLCALCSIEYLRCRGGSDFLT